MSGYPIWMNIVIYQGIWFCGVLGKERLVVLMFLLLALHFYFVKDRLRELLVVFICGSIGIVADSLLTIFGVFEFSPEPSLFPIPVWLLGIWFGFAATFRFALSFFFARPKWLLFIAALGAPITYMAASRLGAVSLPYGHLQTALIMIGLWGAMMGIFVLITQFLDRKALSIGSYRENTR